MPSAGLKFSHIWEEYRKTESSNQPSSNAVEQD
jgi:hypothetical protein